MELLVSDGEYGSIDLEKLMKGATAQMASMQRVQESMASLIGRGEDRDGLVTVEFTAAGLHELKLNPKAMRLSSGELAEKIKTAIADASQDLQRQASDLMADVYGDDNPMNYVNNPEAAMENIRMAQSSFDRTFDDVIGELDRISRRLDL